MRGILKASGHKARSTISLALNCMSNSLSLVSHLLFPAIPSATSMVLHFVLESFTMLLVFQRSLCSFFLLTVAMVKFDVASSYQAVVCDR